MRKDIDLNFIAHPLSGDLATKTDDSAIKQSIKNIVMTNFYERGFNVDLGSNVIKQLFENYDDITLINLRDNIVNAIENFEPMCEIINVEVLDQEDNSLIVKIYYNIFNDATEREVSITLSKIR